MKLSMHILKRWLEDWHPTATVMYGKDVLEGVRMFSPVSQPDPRYVYVARMRDVFPDSTSDEIILANRNDVIHLESYDMEEVFNEVVHAFEFYSDWEYRLLRSAVSHTAFQSIANDCSELFGPTLFQDRTFHIVAMSSANQEGSINPIWDELSMRRRATLELINAFAGSVFMERVGQVNDNFVFHDERTEPYSYGVLNSYNDEDGNLSGQCMITFDRPPDQADLQLIGMVKRALETIPTKIAAREGNQVAEVVLAEALDNRGADEFGIALVRDSLKWRDDRKLCIAVIELQGSSGASRSSGQIVDATAERCRQKLPDCIVLSRQCKLIVCLPVDTMRVATRETVAGKRLGFLLELDRVRVGLSMCFDSLSDSWAYCRQAEAALDENPDSYGLLDFSGIATRALLRHPDAAWYALCVHPVLGLLKDHDLRNGTSYYRTLRQFLACERSFKAVADLQFTHRNTVLYRIERIQQMFPLDLDDPRLRSYLMLSFEIDAT